MKTGDGLIKFAANVISKLNNRSIILLEEFSTKNRTLFLNMVYKKLDFEKDNFYYNYLDLIEEENPLKKIKEEVGKIGVWLTSGDVQKIRATEYK